MIIEKIVTMIVKKILLNNILFNQVDVTNELIESIEQRGISIPVKVKFNGDTYECIDGHKRCSACLILSNRQNKEMEIYCAISNDFSKSGSNYWGARNTH